MSRNSKTAIITGGAQGIGKAIAKAFLEKGWTTVIADTDREAGEETVREFSILGRIEFIQTDVSNEEQVKKLVEQTMQQFESIDALINNAGIAVNKPLETLSLEEWNRVLGINLTGAFLCAKHSSPHLQRNGGTIINIASTRAFMSEACTEAYSASKGGSCRPYPRTRGKPWSRHPGQLHQPGMDRNRPMEEKKPEKSRCSFGRGSSAASRRQGRNPGGYFFSRPLPGID